MSAGDEHPSIPLFPLPNVVHFPGTELKLHIFEPRYRQLVRDLLEAAPENRWIGMVLFKPGGGRSEAAEIFPGGTAGQLVDVDPLPDGRSNILLVGDFRFEVERELPASPYRRAVVRPVLEPRLNEEDPGIVAVRRNLVEAVEVLSSEVGERFPLKPEQVSAGSEALPFEQLVNRIAAEIDLPALSKMSLLTDALPERALHLLGILKSRRQLLDLLRPFRHLASDSDLN
jgi:Lon protease-like protein